MASCRSLTRYKVDYVFYGPTEKKRWKIDPAKYAFLEKVYDDKDVQIFKVRGTATDGSL